MHFFIKKINSKPFTLIELFVVIASVLALMSLLLPSLRKITSRTNDLQCSSNLKQAGIANALYADDFGDFHVPLWMASPGDPYSISKTRWGHLKEFRSYAEWDIVPNKPWMMPHDKACPEAVLKAFDKLSEGNQNYFKTPPLLKVFYTYGHFAIYGNKRIRGMHRYWLQNPSQLGNVGEGWVAPRVSQSSFVPRHDFRNNILFFDGHIESFEEFEFKLSGERPWVDSNGLTLTEINQENALE